MEMEMVKDERMEKKKEVMGTKKEEIIKGK